MKTTIDFLRKELDGEGKNWSKALPIVQLKMNQRSTTHDGIPFEIMFSRKLNHPAVDSVDVSEQQLPVAEEFGEEDMVSRLNFAKSVLFPAVSEKLAKSAERRASTFKRTHALIPNFTTGSLVMVKNKSPKSKFDIRAFGQYKVVHQNRSGSYKLADATGTTLSRTFPAASCQSHGLKQQQSITIFDRIVDDKLANGKQLYRVRWFGWQEDDDTWEAKEAFDDPTFIENNIQSKSPQRGSDVNIFPVVPIGTNVYFE